jgi:hypothetical protein
MLLDSGEVRELLGMKEDEDFDDPVDQLEKKTGLNCGSYGDDYDNFYIGRTYSTLKDDETGKQFRESVETKLKELLAGAGLGKEVKCEHMEEAWNG